MSALALFEMWRNPHGLQVVGWMTLMGAFVAVSCALVGNYLVLRRISLVGDAISHSVLPGIAIAFMISSSRDSIWMFTGALIAGIVTTLAIQIIHSKTRVKEDSAIGITFTTMFAIGVILISVFSGHIDLDLDCVLYGKLDLVATDSERVSLFGLALAPRPVMAMGVVTLVCGTLVLAFYKELLVSSFDTGLAASLGLNPQFIHYALMCSLSVVVVTAFEAVGAILVIAMLIIPAATAYLLTDRFPRMILLSVIHAVICASLGVELAFVIDIPAAPAMVVVGLGLFLLAWVFSPSHGLLRRWFARLEAVEEEAPAA